MKQPRLKEPYSKRRKLQQLFSQYKGHQSLSASDLHVLKGYSLSVLLAFLFVFVEPAPLWTSNKKGWIESGLLQRFFLFLIYILALKRFLKVWLYIFLGQRCLTITSNLWPGFSRMLYKKITVGFLFVCFLWVYFCFPFLMIGFQSTDLIRVFSFGRLFVLP